MKRLNLRTIPRPSTKDGKPIFPTLPNDLTTLDDHQLGRLYTQFAAMASYVQLELAVVAVERAAVKHVERRLRAERRVVSDGTNIPDRDAEVENDSRVREWALEGTKAEALEMMLTSTLQSYLIGRDATSREQTRRQNETRRS